MNVADVISWKKFVFPDGASSNKLLVVVGKHINGTLLLLKTTSQPSKFRPDSDGCHSLKSVHRFKRNLAGFREPTWIQFDPPFEKVPTDIQAAGAHKIFTLKPNDLAAIKNCYKASPDISDALKEYLL